jgi:methylated-DNA-[protein]-cysteine S-methyltransferase
MPAVLETCIGRVMVEWTSRGISRVVIGTELPPRAPGTDAPEFVHSACAAIEAHLAGELKDFKDIPIDIGHSPAFFQKIWTVLRNISEPGSIMTYGQLARAAGSPGATRAAGSSMRRNPVPLIVPCHRVVAARGLGGYSAGQGLETKKFLIEFERTHSLAGRGEGVSR